MKIVNRYTGELIFELDASVVDTVLAAIKAGADLTGADLTRADLTGADLYGASLTGADLYGAKLAGAKLAGAKLTRANLTRANLYGASLTGADLYGASLTGADLTGADLTGADLTRVSLYRAVNAEIAIAQTRICPDGDIIGWKKCNDGVIVKLLIPKEAKRNNAFGRKCRAEFADVLEIIGAEIAYSSHSPSFAYEVGKRVLPVEPFDENYQDECASGIHFFITRLEAENYSL